MTEQFRSSLSQPLDEFRVVKVGLDPSREQLRARLLRRTQRMFELGLLEEVRSVLGRGYSAEAKALQSIGYRQALEVLAGQLELQEAIEQTFIATAQYAKRQWTWFRRDRDVMWFSGFGDEVRIQQAVVHHLHVGVR